MRGRFKPAPNPNPNPSPNPNQVNGKPSLAELLRPERRIHLYGASPYWSYLHLGEARAQERAARPPLGSAAFYTEPEGEALRFVRLLRLNPSPQRFSV